MIAEISPVGSSNSNGIVERVIETDGVELTVGSRHPLVLHFCFFFFDADGLARETSLARAVSSPLQFFIRGFCCSVLFPPLFSPILATVRLVFFFVPCDQRSSSFHWSVFLLLLAFPQRDGQRLGGRQGRKGERI